MLPDSLILAFQSSGDVVDGHFVNGIESPGGSKQKSEVADVVNASGYSSTEVVNQLECSLREDL